MYGARLARWERAVEWPLTGAAVVFFAAYAWEILAGQSGQARVAEVIMWATWAVFFVDYVVRIVIAKNRFRWFSRHLLDLAIVVLPMLRPLRLMRFLTIIALIQRGAGGKFRGQVLLYTAAATVLTIIIGGLAVYDAERGTGSIETFGDAIWWSFVTITTVGYGDYFPVTLLGRLVAVGLMVGGIALIGVVTATLASWIVQRVSDSAQPEPAASEQQMRELHAEVAELKALVARLVPAEVPASDTRASTVET